jgi:hypothetical protein
VEYPALAGWLTANRISPLARPEEITLAQWQTLDDF